MRDRPAGALLRELERLPHDGRVRRMVGAGRRAADPPTAALLRDLAGGDVYERRLALVAVFGSGDGSAALAALDDPSASLRALGARLLARFGEDDQLRRALESAPPARRRPLLRRFRQQGRDRPIDAFLDALAAAGDPDLPRLLPYGSPAAVDRHFAAAFAEAGLEDWRRLTRLHPDAAARALLREAEAAAEEDPGLTQRAAAGLPLLARRRPDAAVALARALARTTPLSRLPLRALRSSRPGAVADLLAASDDAAPAGLDLSPVAHRLGRERLETLLALRWDTLRWTQRWFPRLLAPDREAIYRAFAPGFRDQLGVVPQWIVAGLPRPLREAEGRRHLALPALAADPATRLPYAAYLPWDEARAAVAQALGDPEAALRAVALGALAGAVRYQRPRLGDLLVLAHQRRREQDPVRVAVLGGLADLPPGTWQPEHLEPLGQVLRDALDAADLSPASAWYLQVTLVKLLPHHPEWAGRWLATVVRERGSVTFLDLEGRLSDADVRRVAPALLPVLRSWAAREHEGALLEAARSLGRRLRLLPELLDLLEETVRESRSPYLSEHALAVLAAHARERLPTLIPSLVAADRSWGTRRLVYQYLHRRRQDLLDPFLGRKPFKGRFTSGRTRFVIPVTEGFFRWTPRQQREFAETLRELTADAQRDTPALHAAVRQLAALAAVPPATLTALAGPGGRLPAVRDAALRALARRDTGDGLPALLAALQVGPTQGTPQRQPTPTTADEEAAARQAAADRARIAVYALRRALLELPPAQALAILRDVDTTQVTVAKEVARLLGDLRSDGAFRELLAWSEGDLHRDVRVAVIRALWAYPDREETWDALERAAADPDPAPATMAGRLPADRLSPAARRRLLALLARLLGHPEPRVRLHVLQRCAVLPVRDDARVLLPSLLAVLQSPLPGLTGLAASALFATYAATDTAPIGEAVARLLPNRWALRETLDALLDDLRSSRRRLAPAARAVLDVLAGDPLTATYQARLTVAAYRGPALAGALADLARRDALHADALAAAAGAIERGVAGEDAASLLALETALAAGADERLRRLALAALIAQSRAPQGWDVVRLERLQAFRADPAPLVAGAAVFTLPEPGLGP